MQIVRELAGYSYGRSDLVRRAMSKKKADVMAKERKNFVYGNEEEGVKGCIANGISEEIGNKIFDEMTDFAKYAFNKAHAACYAVVSYRTAWLKYYYPVEFMAALMTSVVDNPRKVSEYIYSCRQIGIEILPPDVNEGEIGFSVSGNQIRYGLSAIKGVGKPVIEALVEERKANGTFTGLRNFVERLSGKEVTKRTVESFIKAGAFGAEFGTRKQLMQVYTAVIEDVAAEKKKGFAGQLSLFDLAGEEDRQEFEIRLPNVGEYTKEELLGLEKEVLGIYISGHPLEEYLPLLQKHTTADALAFWPDEETGVIRVKDGDIITIGGILSEITRKTTKTNTTMAFLTLEDLLGTVEIIVFPRDYEKYRNLIVEDAKVLIRGRVSAEEDRAAKLICMEIIAMDDLPRELWIRFPNKSSFFAQEESLYAMLSKHTGKQEVVIYLEEERAVKRLPKNYGVTLSAVLIEGLKKNYGEEQIKIVEKKR